MNTVWILLVSIAFEYRGSLITVGSFATEADCKAVAADVQEKAKAQSGMPNLRGICVQAKNFKSANQ